MKQIKMRFNFLAQEGNLVTNENREYANELDIIIKTQGYILQTVHLKVQSNIKKSSIKI